MRNNKILKYLPQVIIVLAGLIAIILHFILVKVEIMPLVQVIGSGLVVFIVPKLVFIIDRQRLWFLNMVYALFIILTVDFGSVLGFYDLFLWWDTMMHGFFGFICSISLYILFLRELGGVKNWVKYLLTFLATMGCGALWEFFEFSVDNILGNDTQRVAESISIGKTPVYDTMIDMIITIGGFVGFMVVDLLYRKKIKKK